MNQSDHRDGESELGGENPQRKVVGTDSAAGPGETRVEPDKQSNEGSAGGIAKSCILPPGHHPYDPVKKDIDPVAFALDRVQTFLIWIAEHRATFETLRHTDQEAAETELSCLRNSTRQGMKYLQRLSELVLAGYTIDPNKRLPASLGRGWFSSWVKRLNDLELESQENKPENE